jgi:hypothetical protein
MSARCLRFFGSSDLQELVSMREGVFAHRHQLANFGGSVGKSETVLEIALVLAELLRELANAVAVLANHLVVDHGFVDRGEILALEVLDDRDLERGLVVDLFDEGGDRGQSGTLCRSPAALAGDQLVVAVGLGSDQDRLEDAVLPTELVRSSRPALSIASEAGWGSA